MLWACAATAAEVATPIVDLARSLNEPYLARSADLLEDTSQTLDLTTVQSLPESHWVPVQADVLPISYSRSAWWVRLKVTNSGDQTERRVLEVGWPLLDWLDMFVIGEDGRTLTETRIGDQRPFADRPLRTRILAIPFETPSHATRTVYLRLALSDGVMDRIPLRLWERATLTEHLEDESLGMGIYFGGIMAIMVYNLLIYLVTRDRNFLRYSAYLAMFAFWIFGFRGYGYAHLWPELPRLNNLFNLAVPALFWAVATAFVTGYLETRTHLPMLHRLLRLVSGALIGLGLMSVADILGLDMPMQFVSSWIVGLITLQGFLFIITGILAYRQGNRSARYFLLAWSCLIVGGLLYVISSLPGKPIMQGVITENGISIGSTLEFLLLSLALGDRYRTLQQLQRSIQQAVERVRMRQDVLETITHELRAPLTVISTAIQMLALNSRPTEPQDQRRLDDILVATQRLSALVDQSASGPAPLYWEGDVVSQPCDLKSLLESAAKGARLLARSHDLRVEMTIVLRKCNCDMSLTSLALANLADNAVKHTPPGSVVTLRAGSDRHEFWLEVADNGPGMDAEAMDRVFQPGFRLNASIPGTGHGLALARKLIEIQGGTLTLQSQPGQGSRFRIRLPHHD